MAARYAVYFAPAPDSLFESTAAQWLGRNARTGEDIPQVRVAALTPARLREITSAPRKYGFHATLKPPFRLAEGKRESDLLDAAARFAADHSEFLFPQLGVATLGGFIALKPMVRHAALDRMAARCVEAFEPFRAPLTDEEYARRKPHRLSEAQRRMLNAWGYPYVLEEFRFHMTLSEPVSANDMPILLAFLDHHFGPALALPLQFDAVTLFRQPESHAPFETLARFELVSPALEMIPRRTG